MRIDHRLVTNDQFGWNDRRSALPVAAASDVGDLATERCTVHGIREAVSRLTHRKLNIVFAHDASIAKNANLAP